MALKGASGNCQITHWGKANGEIVFVFSKEPYDLRHSMFINTTAEPLFCFLVFIDA